MNTYLEPRQKIARTPVQNYRAICDIVRALRPLELRADHFEEAVLYQCFKDLGTSGYNRTVVQRAIAAVQRASVTP